MFNKIKIISQNENINEIEKLRILIQESRDSGIPEYQPSVADIYENTKTI